MLQIEKENSAQRLSALSAIDRISAEKMSIMNHLAEKQKELVVAAEVSSRRRVQAAQDLSIHRQLAEKVFYYIILFMFMIAW